MITDSVAVTICNGDSVVIGPHTYTLPGIYTDTIAVTGACRKIVVTQVSTHASTDSVAAILCQGDSLLIGNAIDLLPGIYKDTLVSAAGCDSIVITTLSITPLRRDSNIVNICNGDSAIVGNHVYTLSGTYTDTVAVPGACKKIIVTQLTIHNLTDSITAVICNGDSLYFGFSHYSLPGVYSHTFQTAAGCDSTVVLTLRTTLPVVHNSSVKICEGDSVLFGQNYYSHAGLISDTIATAGCDSISNLQLSIDSMPIATIVASKDSVLPGETIQLSSIATSSYFSWSGTATFTNSNQQQTAAVITIPSWIYLILTNSTGCTNRDSIRIEIKSDDGDSCEDALLFMPNTFTPNDDGVNDQYNAVSTNIQITELLIFNRWGEEIYESKDSNARWDGTFNNSRCPQGVYYFLIKYNSCKDGRPEFKYGTVMLLY